jgi:hypothetical protein
MTPLFKGPYNGGVEGLPQNWGFAGGLGVPHFWTEALFGLAQHVLLGSTWPFLGDESPADVEHVQFFTTS